MTEKMAVSAQRVLASGTELIAVSPECEPPSIEGWYDDGLAVPGSLAEVKKVKRRAVPRV